MIQYKYGDVLAVPSGIIVHQTNTGAVMGSGIAKQVREKFPVAYDAYIKASKADHGLILGEISFAKVDTDKYIVNLNGQATFGGAGVHTNYVALEVGFKRVLKLQKNIEYNTGKKLEICMPRIGCGLANGSWDQVEPIIQRVFPEDVIVKVFDWMV